MKDKLNDIPSDNLNDDMPNRDYWTNRWDNWSQPYLNIVLNSGILNTNNTAYAYKNMLVSREDMSKIVILQKHLIKPISDEPIQQIESAVKYKDFMIDNINKKNTKYTLNEVIENTIQAPSDRQVIIDNAVKNCDLITNALKKHI